MLKKNTTSVKYQIIGEILGLLEEKGLSKEWLLTSLRKKKINFLSSATSNSFEILESCSEKGNKKILQTLQEEHSVVKDIKTLTKSLHWFFTDMVGSSNPSLSVKAQARKINVLNAFIENSDIFKKSEPDSFVILPTGDGMAIGFTDSPEKPLLLSIQIHKALKKYNKSKREKDRIEIRIGMDTGPVYFMKGIADSDIFWGPGLILARRVMDMCGPNQILASDRIAKDLRRLSEENRATIHPIGDYTVKHGEFLTIYNIFGKDFGNRFLKKKDNDRKDNEIKPDFEFRSVELILDVKDPKTMLTHHTWIWDVRNLSENPLEQIFYHINGDIGKNFAEMHVQIHDGENNDLDIISLDVNRPHEKQFYVQLRKPLKKNQRTHVKLEYDWEEPERVYEYVFSSDCKKFKYKFTIPNSIQIKNRVLEVVRELGIKKRADPPPKILYHKSLTEIIWETQNKKISAHNAYEFHW